MNDQAPRWYHRLYVGMQYLLPQHQLSALMFRLTRTRWRPFKDIFIRVFVSHFRVVMTEALEQTPTAYPNFNAFFTRALRPETRPIAAGTETLACPADGAISQLGRIEGDRIFQAKGIEYSLLELLGGDPDRAASFAEGSFLTIYLSPRDYHRVHMPLGGNLREMVHLPGRLFSVNRITTSLVPRLFSRNERLVCLFEGEFGPMAIILVGAIFVGSMETTWSGQVTPLRGSSPSRRYAREEGIDLAKGEEMGRFNMGSTVILLHPRGAVEWESTLSPGDPVRMGQALGRIRRLEQVA